MRWLSLLLKVAAIGAAVVFAASYGVESYYGGKAQLIQRMQVDAAAAELFGDTGTPVGSPQMMIIEDDKAFLPGEGEGGAKLVSENYLNEKGIYPLQLQTVKFFSGTARMVAIPVLVLSLLILFFTRGKPTATSA